MVQINDRYYENLNFDALDAIIESHRSEGADAAAEKYASAAVFDMPVARLVSNPPPVLTAEAVAAATQPPPPENKVD